MKNLMNQDYFISTDKSLLSVELIHQYLSEESYWAKGIPIEKVRAAIENSLTFGVYHGSRQVGFARVVTDYSCIAYLGDVFVLPGYRGRGLSKALMEEIKNHPSLQGLRRWILLTRDAHALYDRFGWKPINDPARWMEIHDPKVYDTPLENS